MDDRFRDPDYYPSGTSLGKGIIVRRGAWFVRVPVCEDCERVPADGTYEGRKLCVVCLKERQAYERSRI
jgi:hypothetical protein